MIKLSLNSIFVSLLLISSAYCKLEQEIITPKNCAELVHIVKNASQNNTHITIQGAGKGVSGKNSLSDTTYVDLSKLNKVINLDVTAKTITVQAGITWKEIQEVINRHGLSVAAMQSYNDFSVGGSIGVNAHGQDFRFAPVGSTIISLQMINPQGETVTVSPHVNAQLFHAVIGGYGLFGIITEVTLQLTDNKLLKKRVKQVSTQKLASLTHATLANQNIALFSGRLTLGSQNFFDSLLTITYYNTPKTTTEKLQPLSGVKNFISQQIFAAMRKNSGVKDMRLFVEKNFIEKKETLSRNNAMNHSIDHVKEHRSTHIDILQEYFIPLKNIQKFTQKAKAILQKHNVNILNATLRIVKKDITSILPYAPEHCGTLVFFVSIKNNAKAYHQAQAWAHELINAALECHGTFYLPYQCFATKEQVRMAYPQFDEFIKLKKLYDPQEIFVNDLYLNYK